MVKNCLDLVDSFRLVGQLERERETMWWNIGSG
jgi:hypothetical protein